MVTGDNPLTALAVARDSECGLIPKTKDIYLAKLTRDKKDGKVTLGQFEVLCMYMCMYIWRDIELPVYGFYDVVVMIWFSLTVNTSFGI